MLDISHGVCLHLRKMDHLTFSARASRPSILEQQTMQATTESGSALDTDELLHLAIKASEASDHDTAITYLKRAIDVSPDNAGAYYMLGAEHAEIGMFERAITEMQHAVDAGIELPSAHFQLGLLYLTSSRVEEAINAWAPLDKLAPSDPLYLFKTGLTHLAHDEFAECAAAIKQGLETQAAPAALNKDMAAILEQVRPHLGDANTPQQASPPSHTSHHVLLSAYRGADNDDHSD